MPSSRKRAEGEKILITGHRGFVGKYLFDFLAKKSHKIFGLDLPQCDITKAKQVEEKILKIAPDQIYHLAGFAKTTGRRNLTFKVNVDGTLNILNAAKKLGKGVRILLASSGMVYGNCHKAALETDPIKPIGDYAESKAQMEKRALNFKDKNLDSVIARAFNHTGPGQKLGFVVPDFACQIARIEKSKLATTMKVGDLTAKRDFLDVREVVLAYKKIMEKGKLSLYNIATAKPHSIEQILKILLSFSKVKIDIQIDKSKLRPSDVQKSTGSIAKIKKELGWQPKIPLAKTLKDTMNFWRKNI